MPLIVQKFGGTSVADSQKILAAARKAIRAQQEGNQVVTVVSAMGHTTDILVEAGIKGILNYAPVPLRVPEGVFLEERDMTMSLETVAFFARKTALERK
jgi:NADH/NAD ratio-sensing transcriptional regulator Rex